MQITKASMLFSSFAKDGKTCEHVSAAILLQCIILTVTILLFDNSVLESVSCIHLFLFALYFNY